MRKAGWKNWADGAFFFAGIMYGIGIWQVGQVFHMPADLSNGMWLWALGVFLMAWGLNSAPLHQFAVAMLAVWIENAMRNREDTQSVIVELVVAPNGKASIKEVHVKGK